MRRFVTSLFLLQLLLPGAAWITASAQRCCCTTMRSRACPMRSGGCSSIASGHCSLRQPDDAAFTASASKAGMVELAVVQGRGDSDRRPAGNAWSTAPSFALLTLAIPPETPPPRS
ncbi:MAG TPA: hypothetical protein VEZ11_00065 [Thermoanaerobaculia bacterium]|nr:hypothetical protein [Thermoanaerobaculia bacterium]